MKKAGRIALGGAMLLLSTRAMAQEPAPATAPAPGAHIVHATGAKFEPFPNMPDCAKGAVLHGNPEIGPSTILVRSTGRCRIPMHWHTPNEQLMMVSGAARLAMKGQPAVTLQPRSYAFLPSKHQHEFSCAAACSFFVAADGPFDIHYVDDAGNEIPFEQAVKAPAKK